MSTSALPRSRRFRLSPCKLTSLSAGAGHSRHLLLTSRRPRPGTELDLLLLDACRPRSSSSSALITSRGV
eukprot:754261-Hanusia_phi.AAC.2